MSNSVTVQIKKLVEHAEIPEYSREGDAGLDLVATDRYHDRDFDYIEYGTGISVKIPQGYVGLVFPRSSISKTPHSLANAVGVIDSNYTGEIKLRFRTAEDREDLEYGVGDRVGQLIIIPYPKVTLEEVSELETTNRGVAGFGSSGR
jgi:dUTP pyrophosphatase